ncbi:MAG TPA: hypothetical protein VMU66_06165, partial [Gaiellales bacterium]|nr:hypothetical protein [Gaiellales bacterium]
MGPAAETAGVTRRRVRAGRTATLTPSHLRRCAWALVAALAIAIALAAPGAWSVGSHRAGAAGARTLSGRRALTSLPVRAQGPISSAIGAGESRFYVRRLTGGWALAGGGVSASFGARVATVTGSARGPRLALSVAGIGRGSRLITPGAAAIAGHANRVSYGFAGLREWFAGGPLGIEQGFSVTRRPVGARGQLTLSLTVGGGLRARLARSGTVNFYDGLRQQVLSYGGLSAVDAAGRRLPATLALSRGRLLLRVADSGARYPITIDPFIQQGAKLVGD